MKNEKVVKELLEVIGGKENIANYEHCATRLRIILKDNSVIDKEKAESLTDSKGYFYSTGQHQFVFGTGKVNEVYADFDQMMSGTDAAQTDQSVKSNAYANMSPVQKIIRILADILVPLIPALVTTGLLMGVRGLLIELGFTMTSDFESLFVMLTDTAFAFLPVLITYSATRKFGGNQIIGIVVGLMMVAPQLPNAYAVLGGDMAPLSIFGISVYGYQGSIFPAIIAGLLISKLDKWFRTWVPQIMDLVVTPFLTLTVTLFIILFILGPVIQGIESVVINALVSVINAPFGIGYILFGGLQQLLVITGLHHSIGIIEINLISNTGFNVIQPLTTASMAGQFGAAIGTALLMKDKVRRTNMISSALPTLFGITEPLLFGVNLLSLRIFFSGVIAGSVGGVLIYIFDLSATGMGITFVPGLLLYVGQFTALIQYLIVIGVAFVLGIIIVRLQGKQILEEFQIK
ncbi:PTS transporter subunit EIIC [Atopobacter phocae]|uniref:PTS transporter subunit EIIC n=1 Tax=Atopobacter phocae TaxID=136492 RepID=UPI0004B78A77|nr:PTS transporter subunit EIIC [Atopobacter phocae]